MAKVIPFRGIYYNREKVSADEVVAPPYDVISPEKKEKLYALSRYNTVRVDFGKDLETDSETENRYTRAAEFMRDWLQEGILLRSEKPSFYAYRMDYALKGREMSLTGFFGLVKLVELGEGVYPHEATHSKPKYDRLTLLEVAQANTSPIFSLYSSPEKKASAALAAATGAEPYMRATDSDGSVHSFWVVEDDELIRAIRDDLQDKDVFIADGHHRYETALDYQRIMRGQNPGAQGEQPYDYVLMFLANTHDEGISILPTHRLIKLGDSDDLLRKLRGCAEVEELPADADIAEAIRGLKHAFGLYYEGGLYLLRYRGCDADDIDPALRDIDVILLHEVLFKKILGQGKWGYEMDVRKSRAMVDSGRYSAAFFLNPPTVHDVEKVSQGSGRLPPKSTYFYPKVRTGFVINSLKSF